VRALVVGKPGAAAVREWPDPLPAADEVLVTPLLAGVCGTDLELVDGTIDPAYVHYPLVLGHEWVGRLEHDVAGVGPAGKNVVVEGIIPCGTCATCARGAHNICAVYDEIGFTRPGAIAEHVSVPERLVHLLSDDVEPYDAAFVEPMAVVWRALTRLPLRPSLNVAVIGDGTIALLAAHLVRLFNPLRTTVFGRRDEQRELALLAGADEFDVSSPSQLFDLVIEASGSGEGVATAIDHCARGGMVILLGLPPHGTKIDLAPDDLVNNDVMIQGSFSYTREAFADVVGRLNTRELRPSFLITHRFELENALDALATLRGGATKEPRGKVIINVTSP
jgi:threonine dehydrogenase-like Zn-dependent dehydrogenase